MNIKLRNLLTGAAILATAWALMTLWSGRRISNTHYDGNRFITARHNEPMERRSERWHSGA